MGALLSVQDLSSGYRHLKVLHDISLEIDAASLTAIIGPNGHGKSTLLKALAGLLPTWTGAVTFDGTPLPPAAPERARAGLTLVPQGDQLFMSMTVEENLLMGAFARSDRGAVRKTLEDVYSLFPRLRERRAQRANSLSGGERRMAGIGRGMMAAGKLMMIDEPSLGLAPLIIEQIYEALILLAKEGQSILVVEENPSRVAKIASRFHLMDGGTFAWSGSADELEQSSDVVKTYLGD
ncbi:ABC transporter ATP-binding protein [Mesorhizobium sp.]|uniref:ABC transporter ATP-binding protein n=1 Tax=Mesorhizobium sp. TaxID=1871066 RepID=UPI000FE6A9C7|nr:ABC transporter ATP-binding protein [Mesorhizobium sp.]RWJ31998.1 MAG: ABC transporter ATP-binding protein [Mesorhizobium sp.]TIQ73796.1 MAG: ABC transporter ATP-binding protein [Mesorhizobium sp.]